MKVNLPLSAAVTTIAVYQGKIYYADDGDQSIYVADKTTGNSSIKALRNNTSGVLALRIYDANDQTGGFFALQPKRCFKAPFQVRIFARRSTETGESATIFACRAPKFPMNANAL